MTSRFRLVISLCCEIAYCIFFRGIENLLKMNYYTIFYTISAEFDTYRQPQTKGTVPQNPCERAYTALDNTRQISITTNKSRVLIRFYFFENPLKSRGLGYLLLVNSSFLPF